MERAMSIFEHMNGWADALNLADPTVHKEVCQAVYIFQDGGDPSQPDKQRKHGFRCKMVNKPFMGLWTEDSNVMHIFERIFCVCMPELYLKLVRARILLEADSVSEVINMLADAEVIMQLNNEYRKEFEDAARTDGGKSYAYGRKTKSVQHRTPDSLAQDQRIKFDYGDREAAEREADDD
jgi:hypothetical protein